MDLVNPDDFVITRKRKKYKFAKFANSPICYEHGEWLEASKDVLQGPTSQQIVVEVGAGTGLFSVELASRHPEVTYVAVDVKADRLQKGAYEAHERELTNVYFVRARADQLADVFPPRAVAQVWLTFPDPFPRPRSARRRMTHPLYLDIYRQLLIPEGSFCLKHDNPDFFHWSLEQLVAQKWHIEELSFDLHESALADDYKILTTYERRWLDEGLRTNFVRATASRRQ